MGLGNLCCFWEREEHEAKEGGGLEGERGLL